MSNPNQLTRIERKAKEYAEGPHYSDGSSLSCSPQLYLKRGYLKGYAVATDRAAPVVKALEDRLTEWQIEYNARYAVAERMRELNESANPKLRVDYPEIPAWVTETKQILETFKADV